jgi:hypothetical protein
LIRAVDLLQGISLYKKTGSPVEPVTPEAAPEAPKGN